MDLWVFDNDGTLYDDTLVHEKFNRYLASYLKTRIGIGSEDPGLFAQRLKVKHQTSSAVVGLVREFGLDAQEVIAQTYLLISLEECKVPFWDRDRDEALSRLRGRKIILTNNPSAFAGKVMDRIGLRRHFLDIIGMQEVDFVLKPDPRAFQEVVRRHPDATRIFLCDDSLENLDVAASLGWKTVWYQPDKSIGQGNRTHLVARSFKEVAQIAMLI